MFFSFLFIAVLAWKKINNIHEAMDEFFLTRLKGLKVRITHSLFVFTIVSIKFMSENYKYKSTRDIK